MCTYINYKYMQRKPDNASVATLGTSAQTAFRCGTGWADTSTMMSRWDPSNPSPIGDWCGVTTIVYGTLLRLRHPRLIFNELIICTWQNRRKDNKKMATNDDGDIWWQQARVHRSPNTKWHPSKKGSVNRIVSQASVKNRSQWALKWAAACNITYCIR